MKALGCVIASAVGCLPPLLVCFVVLFEFGCAPAPQVACSGPAPITCECVDSCSSDDAGVITTNPDVLHPLLAEGCNVRCWDRSRGGP